MRTVRSVAAFEPGHRRTGRLVRTLLLALLVGGTNPAVESNAPPPRWVPEPPAGKKADPRLKVEGDRATFREEGLVLEIELLDAEHRALFLASAGVPGEDPFTTEPGERPFVTFLVRLENGTKETVRMRPESVLFVSKRPIDMAFPCDETCLWMLVERAGYSREQRDHLLRATLSTPLELASGGRISKLLVYNRVPERYRMFTLDFGAIDQIEKAFRFSLPYGLSK